MDFQNYKQIVGYFSEDKIDYVLLRYPHLLPREIHDLDILIEKKEEYRRALHYLRQEGFICLEKESFRSFWAKKIGNQLVVLDIYNRISWLGWTLLDKNQVLHRKRKLRTGIAVCSDEDELLVYLAQALFRNNGLDRYKTAVVRKLMEKKLDWNYIIQQMKRHGWSIPGRRLLSKVRTSRQDSVKRTRLDFVNTLLAALTVRRMSILISRSIHFLTNKIMPEHRSTTICLLGPDGSGKSTLAKSLKQEYQRFFQKFNPQIKMVYFGWKPFLPTTKLVSSLLKKRKYNVVEKSNTRKKNLLQKTSQSLLFSYFFIEYLARYIWIILPLRDEKKIIILDRYFYDLFAHYQHASKSRWCKNLLKKFPRTDYLFLLDVPVEQLRERKQELSKEQLLLHQQKYHQLQKMIPFFVIDTTNTIEHSRNEIISKTWKMIVRRLT